MSSIHYDFELWRYVDIAATSFGSVGADAFQLMMKQVDLESNKQSELAQNVLSAMLLGPPTTTPAIPTRTDDPNAEKTSTEGMVISNIFMQWVQLVYLPRQDRNQIQM